ncbi:MAG: hypothetical protein M1814_003230 [Vezdaea aestivalis]|nr:MAG: hypothetical protein M1814_003230 [Vezdaea aestivalis]
MDVTKDDTSTPQYSTGDKTSFAYISARDRWPVILTGAIDDVHRACIGPRNPQAYEEGKVIISSIATLKYELQHNRQIAPLSDDGGDDIKAYNEELETLGQPSWFDVPWLFAECYLYRRLHGMFKFSEHWKSYDVFAAQKMNTFRSSRPAILELAANYASLLTQLGSKSAAEGKAENGEAARLLFHEMSQICLWGNATDLSLLTSLNYADIQKLQGASARKESEKNILANDLDAAYKVLSAAKTAAKEDRTVDIVLDNAGFELFVDLVLAGYLLEADLATTVILRPKTMPWFVSDVIPQDFSALLSALDDPSTFFGKDTSATPLSESEIANLSTLYNHWATLHTSGRLILRPSSFWTTAASYWRLPRLEPLLLKDLQDAELVIYKGDLNYRKLTGDAAWDPTTPFEKAIGPLGKGSRVRTLALRTCKADVVVGLEPGKDEELRAMEGGGGTEGRKWGWSGKWAVVQFCDGKM